VVDRRGEARDSLVRAMEEEMGELRRRNEELELIVRNAQTGRKRVTDEEKDARRRLKQLEKENEELRGRLRSVEQSH
jgi:predicted  nucleic acid-binding Zn-ribbon protein